MMKVHVFNFFPVYFNGHFNLVYIILKHNIIDTPTQPRSEFEMRLQNLKEKHAEDTPEFKLKVWAKNAGNVLQYYRHIHFPDNPYHFHHN